MPKQKIFIFLPILFFSFFYPVTYGETSQASPSQYDYSQIRQEYDKGNLSLAKTEALSHLKQYPQDVDVQFLLGAIYFKEKSYDKASTTLTNALNLSPHYRDIRLLLIQTKLAQGDFSKALLLAQEGLKENPSDKDFLKAKENSLYALKQQKIKETKPLQPSPPPISYQDIKTLFDSGNTVQAESLAKTYLKNYPKDLDVKYLLALIYLKKDNTLEATNQLEEILKQKPQYLDARLLLININIGSKNYDNALKLTNEGLIYFPNNTDLLLKKANILYSQHQYQEAKNITQEILKADPKNSTASTLYESIINTPPLYGRSRNTVGFNETLLHNSLGDDFWDFSSVYYGYDSDYGYMQARVNYANRLGESDPQGLVEAYPQINQYVYLDVKAGYANNPVLFPDYLFGGEVYTTIPSFLTVSFGDTYNNVNSGGTYYNAYTGSLSKYLGDNDQYWISFRPYHFVPNAGPQSTLYTGSIRRYFGTPDFYINFTVGGGYSPDLTDLQTVDFIQVKDNLYSLYMSFPLAEHSITAILGVSDENLKYPSGNIRKLIGGTVGLAYRFD